MPQLKCDEWPDDGEPTTTEQEVPLTSPPSTRDNEIGRWIMTNSNDILEHVVVRVPCTSCGERYGVSLRQITASQDLLHDVDRMWDEGCPNYCREPACELVTYASLVDEATAHDAAHAIIAAVDRLAHAGVDVGLAATG